MALVLDSAERAVEVRIEPEENTLRPRRNQGIGYSLLWDPATRFVSQ
jgi:hypothetical protein